MKQLFLSISMVISINACNKVEAKKINAFDTESITEEKNNVVNITSHEVDNKTSNYDLNIPEFGSFDLRSMNIDKTHLYGSGDYEGRITRYTSEQRSIIIDSSSYGEYGYIHTCYLLNQDNLIQKIYQSEWESLNGGHNNYTYVITERIFNFKNAPPIQLKRKDTINEHYMASGKYPEPLSKDYNQIDIGDKNLIYWKNELSESWLREYDINY